MDRTRDIAYRVGQSIKQTEQILTHNEGYFKMVRDYIRPIGDPTYEAIKYLWGNFPPARWLIYALLTFNSIPLMIFVGWFILTLGFVFALAGVGILCANGFFTFLGLVVFVPVAIVLIIVAFVGASIATFGWAGLNTGTYVLSNIGTVGDQHTLNRGKRRESIIGGDGKGKDSWLI
ncbi:23268_t:CDS:1 [Entrophospora sp. SA101]|nr:12942_t:CDS:1 [Entrophospora sp. SA101]CAJ0646160.1 3711_t:CDS:1 [Entrophospora sp. SA101]CAJ0767961.1 23268_t:CDS:1 [Entrophospora sp. SA101]CAJ0843134.1 1866_t:CDS:1 [Entrophospora sp. SA101]CAJ0908272.1 1978_t:CDS:1 [Entrophospora sp. SA101]